LPGRPNKIEAKKHPLYGKFNGEVPWLDGCTEHNKKICLDCSVPWKNAWLKTHGFIKAAD
jgi:hypothetical protein